MPNITAALSAGLRLERWSTVRHYSPYYGMEHVWQPGPGSSESGGRWVHTDLRLEEHEYRRKAGRNLLRKFHGVEMLTRLALDRSEEWGGYGWYLQTSDNDHWLGPLDLRWFEARLAALQAACRRMAFWERKGCLLAAANGTAFSKGCRTYGLEWVDPVAATWDPTYPQAVNDKTILLTAAAAKAWAARVYSEFWSIGPRGSRNLEQHLGASFRDLHVRSQQVPFDRLPTADSYAVLTTSGKRSLCQTEQYICNHTEAMAYADLHHSHHGWHGRTRRRRRIIRNPNP
mmetsp:Transcript_39374/g.115560  ORF Transcript_39374/g.115560 Transcript_39374/m.115560 type:complete len:287 (-) Transcript_39374:324-1184(-)